MSSDFALTGTIATSIAISAASTTQRVRRNGFIVVLLLLTLETKQE
jgi:hypothetical protein